MKEKLLDKTLKVYLAFSLLVLGLSAPLFFYVTKGIQLKEADEMLMLRLHEFEKFNAPTLKSTDIVLWNTWNKDLKIEAENVKVKGKKLSNASYSNSMDGDEEPFRVLRAPITIDGQNYTFFSRINLLESRETLYSMAILYISIILLLLIGLYFITRRYSAKLWKPFLTTLDRLETYDLKSQNHLDLTPSSIEEFQRMNLAIEKLIERNVSIYTNQKEFVENAAHELQTPLAVMRAKLDNLMQNDFSLKDSAAIESLNYAVDRLTQLNKNLLLLSRIEHDVYTQKEEVSVNAVIEKQIEFLSEQLIDIKLELDLRETCILNTNTSLLEICLSNLFVNAIKHNVANGKIRIVLERTSLRIMNTGIDLPLDGNRLFQRFYKHNTNKSGTGLGLAIVKKIADLNNWNIAYSFKNNLHEIRLEFK